MDITEAVGDRSSPVAPERAALSHRIMGALISDDELGLAIAGKSGRPKTVRQIRRLVAKGMPYLQIGRERFYDPDKVRAWLAEQVQSRRVSSVASRIGPVDDRGLPLPRRRGRPRNADRGLPAHA